MYTRCPECRQQTHVNAQQLRHSHGMLHCKNCGVLFDALALISDHAEDDIAPPEHTVLTAETSRPSKKNTVLWSIGLVSTLLLLLGQIIYFEGNTLLQNPQLRPWLEKACFTLNCTLPPYRNLKQIRLLNTVIDTQNAHEITFTIILSNQADFPQQYPALKLTLVDYLGRPFAERVFSVDNYRPPSARMAANQTVEIELTIISPTEKIGGYSFNIL